MNNLILGAIVGDIAGEPYEFGNNRNKNVEILTKESRFTDDSILTVAVMKVILDGDFSDDKISDTLADFAKRYPSSYGARFNNWIKDKVPYASLGNGAAMRISPVYYLDLELDEKIEIAKKITNVSHNHPESIKWVSCLVEISHNLLNDKNYNIKKFLKQKYNLDLKTVEYLRENYKYSERIEKTVPESLAIVSESKDFEDILLNSVSIGGDADTIGAIAGGISEIIFGVPNWMVEKVMEKLPQEFIDIIEEFTKKYKGEK